MQQHEYQQIIHAGKPIKLTPDLMAAARERALQQRNAAIMAGARWLNHQFRSILGRATQRKPSHCHC